MSLMSSGPRSHFGLTWRNVMCLMIASWHTWRGRSYLLSAFLPAATGTLFQDFGLIFTLIFILCRCGGRRLHGGHRRGHRCSTRYLMSTTGHVSCCDLWHVPLFTWSSFRLWIRHRGTSRMLASFPSLGSSSWAATSDREPLSCLLLSVWAVHTSIFSSVLAFNKV